MHILTEEQENLVKDERKLLGDLRVALARFLATPEDQDTLEQSLQQLDELFLLVIVGEFNAGKSAFINALLGQRLLKEGVTPTTTQINILRYGDTQDRNIEDPHKHIINLPAELLREISIVDTPGTNAIIREHEEITSQFVPRSDMVLFITSADRPFTESERQFLQSIRNWGKKVVIIINKIDILQSEDDVAQVHSFVEENARFLLGLNPQIFLTSARKGLLAKLGQPELWNESGFETLEQFIHDTLDEKGRLQLKFLSPLGVADNLISKYQLVTESRLQLLKEDFDMLADVEQQLAVYKEDMQRDFQYRIADIDNTLLEMEQRGDAFFEETYRLARIFDLLSKDRIRREFEHQVVGDVPQRIERKVGELIDWLVDTNLSQWQAVNDHIAERRREHQSRIVGDPGGGSFHYDRERVMDVVGREAMRVVETYDKTREAQEIAESAQAAVATSLAIEAGAVGLGTLVTALATTAAADWTGIIAAGVIATLGLVIIPTKRMQSKTHMHEKVASLREQLVGSLKTQFEREMERGIHQIDDAIAPYTRFVRAEREKFGNVLNDLTGLKSDVERLRQKVEVL